MDNRSSTLTTWCPVAVQQKLNQDDFFCEVTLWLLLHQQNGYIQINKRHSFIHARTTAAHAHNKHTCFRAVITFHRTITVYTVELELVSVPKPFLDAQPYTVSVALVKEHLTWTLLCLVDHYTHPWSNQSQSWLRDCCIFLLSFAVWCDARRNSRTSAVFSLMLLIEI